MRIFVPRIKKTKLDSAKDRKKLFLFVREFKKNPCTDCGACFPTEVMDFDHVPGRGEKWFNLANPPAARTFKEVFDEISKCDLVCSNCHRIRHINRRIQEKAGKVSKAKELREKCNSEPSKEKRSNMKRQAKRLLRGPQAQFLPNGFEKSQAIRAASKYIQNGAFSTDMTPRMARHA
jgi:hypothetical protein